MSDQPHALVIRGLTKVYANGVVALDRVDLVVRQGDFFALLGPNGAGKTTTLGIVSSLVNKTAGTVSIFGHDLDSDREAAKRCLGVVPQEFNFGVFEKVRDILVTQAGYYGLPAARVANRVDQLLRELGLWDKRDQQARTLSGGMKRRLMIARALVHDPQLLILDEPTAGVDIELRRSMWAFLTRINQVEGKTIILTTHYLEEAEALCRHIAIIDKGRILENTSKKALLAKLQQETYVCDLMAGAGEPVLPAGRPWRLTGEDSLEVDVQRGTPLGTLFRELDAAGLAVTAIRPKANRLEELFLSLVRSGSAGQGANP